MVAIIDYDAGNIKSVEKAVKILCGEPVVTRDEKKLKEADHVILPGVGAFGDAMGRLESYGLIPVIKEIAGSGKPFLGICLGEQLLFENSEESPGTKGLCLLKGEVKKFSEDKGFKVPNIGWNSIKLQNNGRLFHGIDDGEFFYFVHSYYVKAAEKDIVKAVMDYGNRADVSVEKGNIFATQFHPEKSSDMGLKLLENFLKVS